MCFSVIPILNGSRRNALQHPAIRAAANRIGGDQSRRPRSPHFNLGARLLEPIGDQIRPSGDAPGIEPLQRLKIGIAERAAFLAPAQKRRVAHDDIGLGPFRFGPVRVHDGILLADGVERFEDGVLRQREAVVQHPLNLADPDRDAGEFGGVGVEFESQHVLRADARETARQTEHLGLQDDAVFQILETQQGEQQEVARAAGRVEHPEAGEPVEKALQDAVGRVDRLGAGRGGFGGAGLRHQGGDRGVLGRPVVAQGIEHHGIDEAHDRAWIGVMGAELGALFGVETALEQGAKDRGVDGRPVEIRQSTQALDVLRRQRERGGRGEESAVEPVNRLEACRAARGHGAEKTFQHLRKVFRALLTGLQELAEQLVGQQVDVLGEQTEQDLLAEVGDLGRSMTALAQHLSEIAEATRRRFGQVRGGATGAQPLGIAEGPFEPAPLGGIEQILQVDLVDLWDRAGEGGVDDDPRDIGDDQQRRIFECRGVKLELLEGFQEVLARPFVLPAIAGTFPDIGPTVAATGFFRALLEAVPSTRRVGLGGRGFVEQAAEVDEVFLGRRAFLEGDAGPFGDELFRGHGAYPVARPMPLGKPFVASP
ncbi:hypothetical protein CCR95_01180 [Thiocystis minor]|nr:hypothetical protein [Thiocystis minor]